ncbi:unnamed protein product [Miscanthus lutarioriparius]|uniref:Uncharacterized protein n=1 Tax=Miscanthus lutarioriparius TaxID=422564 RepID=A0A811PHP9_9POAL|nr:unnamed protein product [Miscanthus lutarioriparius]
MAAFVDELKTTMQAMAKQFDRFQDMMSTALDKLGALETWKETADGSLGTLLQKTTATATRVEETASRVSRLEFRPPPPPPPLPPPHWSVQHHPPPVANWSVQHHPPPAAAGLDLNTAPGASSSATPPRPNSRMGHDDDNQIRDAGGGILGFTPPRPGNSTHYGPVSQPLPVQAPASDEDSGHHNPLFPKMEFPKFDGSNPRWWRDQCELYFEVYAIHATMKTRFAALNFKEPVATWLQTVQRRGRIAYWKRLCELVMVKFDKDQYEVLLLQFNALKQTASVLEYQAAFEKLAHGVLLYNPAYDDTFVTWFVGDLRDDIRSALLLHRPRDVDTASALALIQEQELEQDLPKSSGQDFTRSTSHTLEEILDVLDIVDTSNDHDSDEEETPQQEVLTVQSVPNTQQAPRQTLKLLAQIGKHKVLILVDSGSVGTFVSEQLVKHLKLDTSACDTSTFRAADGGVSEVLSQYNHLFAEPTRLPPSRIAYHKIPLVPGAQPVKLMQAPVLVVPDFSHQFVIETDASDLGIGAVLMQNQHPVAYLSKALGPRNQALSVYEKECLAILLAIEKWRPYLQHQPFVIKTDHRSLQHLTEERVSTKIQHKALIKLMDLQYTIQYKKRVNNAAADALSRCEHQNTVHAISKCLPTWVQRLQEGYEDDDHANNF